MASDSAPAAAAAEASVDPKLTPAWWGAGEGGVSGDELVAHVREAVGDDTIESARTEVWLASGGNAGDMFKIFIKHAGDAPDKAEDVLCAKFTKEDRSTSLANGLAREGIFLSNIPEALAPLIPRVRFAAGDLDAGVKVIVADLVDGVQAGYFFGNHSPLNAGKDLAAITAPFPGVTEEDVCVEVARTAAILHASRWNDPILAEDDPPIAVKVLRARDWLLKGTERESWEGSMEFARSAWEKTKAKPESEREGLTLGPKITALLDAAFEKATWDDLQSGLAKRDLTLVHGDFHPGNMIVTAAPEGSDAKFALKFVDFEVIGIGCGPQELGQFMLSHSTPEARRAEEPAVIATYTRTLNEELAKAGKPPVSEETVKERYVAGGLGRFAWMCGVIMHLCPPPFAMYFVNQVCAFADDHGVTPETMPAARA